MRLTLTTRAVVGATLLLAVTLTGCSAETDTPDATAPSSAASGARPDAQATPIPQEAEPVLAQFGIAGLDTVEIIDHLDRLGGAERPADMMASVRPSELLLSAGTQQFSLDIPDDRFYLSVAPYVDHTHECFHHSLTTCQGELTSQQVRVQIMDETNDRVLVDETRTTFENGFVGFWLPPDIEGTLHVTYDGKVGQVDFATDEGAPTCLTTLRLA